MFLFKYIKYILNYIEKAILPAKKGSRQRAPSSHNGVRSLCRLPYWQVVKALPTAFLLAGGKGFFADEFFATCSLPTATCKAVGKAFATCFRTFADCFWQSAKNEIPVVQRQRTNIMEYMAKFREPFA